MTRAREAARLIGNNTFRLDSNNAVGFNSTTPDAMFDINHGLTVAGVSTFTGNVTMSGDLTVQGTTTTLDTVVQEVDLMNIQANSSTPGIGVTQSGSGNIISAYDGTSEVFSVADGGNVGVSDKIIHLGDTDTAVRFPAANTITAETAGTEALRIDSSGRVLVKLGSSITSEAGEAHTPALQVAHVGGNVTNLGISVSRFQASNPNSVPIILQKSRNDTIGSHTIVQDDDALGRVEFAGSDGAKFVTAASIIADVDGTPGTDDMPGRLQFMTTADGASQPTERLRITSAGLVSIQSDTGKFTAGASSEMQVFHDGTDSLIKDTRNSGSVKIQADNFSVIDKDASETMLSAAVDGAVTLNHNGSARVATTADGADISGTGSLKVPVGTTAQRSGSPTAGDFRYNSTLGQFEGYTSEWGEIGGGGGITTTASAPGANTIVYLDLGSAQYHELALSAGITTISCSNGNVGESHVVVINQPSSGIATVGFDTYFEFPSGAAPSMSEGGSAVDMVSFVVKKAAGAGGTELLASAGLNYQ